MVACPKHTRIVLEELDLSMPVDDDVEEPVGVLCILQCPPLQNANMALASRACQHLLVVLSFKYSAHGNHAQHYSAALQCFDGGGSTLFIASPEQGIRLQACQGACNRLRWLASHADACPTMVCRHDAATCLKAP